MTIDDLSNAEIVRLFQLADKLRETMKQDGWISTIRGRAPLAEQFILATQFYESSTRTRMSFESAMLRLGGHVISTPDARLSSAAKGETIADTARVVESYADLLVIRHPWEGAALVASEFAGIPVINAGDGSHEHPTQTLCDLYTLWVAMSQDPDAIPRRDGYLEETEFLRGSRVVLCGDLRHGRTVHSLIYALARFKADIIPQPAPGCELPDHVTQRLRRDYKCLIVPKSELPEADEREDVVDVVYVTPEEPNQLTMVPFGNLEAMVRTLGGEKEKKERLRKRLGRKSIDVFYSTRFQRERRDDDSSADRSREAYPVINREFLKAHRYRHTKVMHPLPRVEELGYDMDADERGIYFQQAAYGVPVRMALISALLGVEKNILESVEETEPAYDLYSRAEGIKCANKTCVSFQESERRYLMPRFWVVDPQPLTLRCVFCDHEAVPAVVGDATAKRYESNIAVWSRQKKKQHLILFGNEEEAREWHKSTSESR